jgi:hypothetical protein
MKLSSFQTFFTRVKAVETVIVVAVNSVFINLEIKLVIHRSLLTRSAATQQGQNNETIENQMSPILCLHIEP